MNKMVINHLDKLFVTSDTATIHPAVKTFGFGRESPAGGNWYGANLTVSFVGELLQGAEDLIRMGLHLSEIIIENTKATNKVLLLGFLEVVAQELESACRI
ncbi:Chaperonin Cpn60/TCP-1, partial [Cynara cardunculus var. scolymus]